MNWTHGYFATDGGYTYGTYAETLPDRLWFASLLYGQEAPRDKYRYLDLGCGQGLNLLIAAATHPDCEFVGVDFMPDHIAHGRRVAKDAGIENVKFVEADFLDLASDPSPLGGQFEYAVTHGITTWVSEQVSNAIYRIVERSLLPSGIFYNSYNTMSGWLATVPFQHMVALEQRRSDGKTALTRSLELFGKLKESNAAVSLALPGLGQRIEMVAKQDLAYVLQEYNNQHWKPKWVSEVIELLARYKLNYLGTATLTEAFDQNYPEAMRSLFSAESLLERREQTRDLCVNQAFRRDLFVKGVTRAWPAKLRESLNEVEVLVNPFAKMPSESDPFVFGSGTIEVKGRYEPYKGIIDVVTRHGESGVALSEIGKVLGYRPTELAHMISLLIHGGWIMLVNPQRRSAEKAVHRLNAVITNAVSKGAPYKHIASATAGTAFGLSEIELILVGQQWEKEPRKPRVDYVLDTLSGIGRQVMKDGKPVEDRKQQAEMIESQISNFENALSHWKTLGAIPT